MMQSPTLTPLHTPLESMMQQYGKTAHDTETVQHTEDQDTVKTERTRRRLRMTVMGETASGPRGTAQQTRGGGDTEAVHDRPCAHTTDTDTVVATQRPWCMTRHRDLVAYTTDTETVLHTLCYTRCMAQRLCYTYRLSLTHRESVYHIHPRTSSTYLDQRSI